MEVNIEDHLSNDEIKRIIEEEVRVIVKNSLRTEKHIERIISNACYNSVSKLCDSTLGNTLKLKLKDKVNSIIDELALSTVFKKPNAWDIDPNYMYRFLQRIIRDEKPRIKEIVSRNIEEQTLLELKDSLHDHVITAVQELFIDASKDKNNEE